MKAIERIIILAFVTCVAGFVLGLATMERYWPFLFTGAIVMWSTITVLFVLHEFIHYTNMWLDRKINKFIKETRRVS